MVAPNIAPVSPYTSRGKTRVYWVEDFANYLAPTRLELDAGIDLSTIFSDYKGFSVKSSQVDVVVLAYRYTGTISGEEKSEDSSVTLLMDEKGADARVLIPKDAEGYIVWLYGGDKPGNKMDIYPVQCSSLNHMPSVKGNEPDMTEFQFAIPRIPASSLAVPAAA